MYLEKFSLKNKTALITGAGGLLGLEHALALLETGAFVFLTDISKKSLKNNVKIIEKKYEKNRFNFIQMDVANEKSVKNCLKKIKKKGKKVDILINNAGINQTFGKIKKNLDTRLENFSLNDWKKEVDVGLTGAFLCCKIFGYEMKKKKYGVILNISSDLSVISPDQRIYEKQKANDNNQPTKPISYSAVKSGLIGLTKYIATYWAKFGVRCNAISPGGIFENQDKLFVKKLVKLIPLGRMARKDEYRSVVQFLCSNASAYMNGNNLVMDGGRSIW